MARISPWLFLFGSIALSDVITGCQHKPEERAEAPSDERPSVRIASLICLQAAQYRDLDRFTSCFADDAYTLAPDIPMVRGKDEARRFWSLRLTNPSYNFRWRDVKLELGNVADTVDETGHYEMDLADRSGKLITTQGEFIFVWKKTPPGEWKIVACTLNTD